VIASPYAKNVATEADVGIGHKGLCAARQLLTSRPQQCDST